MKAATVVLIALFSVALFLVSLANSGELVSLHLFLRNLDQVPLAWVIFGSAGTGVLFSSLLWVIDGLAMRIEKRRLQTRLRNMEAELKDLRHAAIQEPAPDGSPAATRAEIIGDET